MPVDLPGQLSEVGGVFQRRGLIRLKAGHSSKGGSHISLHRISHAVRPDLVVFSVQGDHLSIESIECPYAKVAPGHEVIEAVKAVKDPLHQGIDGRDLEEDIIVLCKALAGEEEGQKHC